MIDVNKVILMGRVGQDAEVKEVGENKVAKFSLATSESFKDKSGEWQEKKGLKLLLKARLTTTLILLMEARLSTSQKSMLLALSLDLLKQKLKRKK